MNENEIPGIESTGGQAETTTEQTVESVASTPAEQTFTKSQVNDLMKKRVQRSHNAFFNRYGVKDLKEMDDLFGKAGSYDAVKAETDELNRKYGELDNQYKDLNKRYGYKSCNIDEKKIADIETYFKGKGIDISEETLRQELKAHPDWVNKVSTIQQLGAESATPSEKDMRAEASRLFGVKL